MSVDTLPLIALAAEAPENPNTHDYAAFIRHWNYILVYLFVEVLCHFHKTSIT